MSPQGYEFIQHLSKGGFGTVHLARRVQDGRLVAIKMLHLPNDANLRRFWREANLLHQQLDNPHVVDLLDWSFDQEPAHLVMEFCVGGSLRGWVNQPRAWPQVVEALHQAATGLEGIHKRGGFHRDIKPDNLLLVNPPNGPLVVKVGDFGLARLPDLLSSGPMTRSAYGTKGYIAPELILGVGFDSRCDVYSLGITGIELLIGKRDRAALSGQSDIPMVMRQLLLAMTHSEPAKRPTIQGCQHVLHEALAAPILSSPAVATPTQRAGAGAAGLALGVFGFLTAYPLV